MSLKTVGVAMLAAVVLAATAADGAFAENLFTKGSQWYTGSREAHSKLVGSVTVTSARDSEKLTLSTHFGGSPLKFAATGVTCVKCTAKNTTTDALVEGVLELTGVTVTEPEHCSVEGGKVTTKTLTAIVGMGGSGTQSTMRFAPAEGTTFAAIKVTGASCPIPGTYKFTGEFFAESTNETSIFAEVQTITLSEAIQKSAGTEFSLKFGESPVYLSGIVSNTFVGVRIGSTGK